MLYFFMKFNLRLLYLYLFSFVGLIIVVIGTVQILNLGLKSFVFTKADSYVFYPMNIPPTDPGYVSLDVQKKQQEEQIMNQRQSELAFALSMIAVGLPLYLYHWKLIGKEKA